MVRESESTGALTLGAPVYSRDGVLLGQVTAIHRRHVQVTPPKAGAYWLSTECIHSTGERGVTLDTNSVDLGDYQMDYPDGADAEDSPDVGGEH